MLQLRLRTSLAAIALAMLASTPAGAQGLDQRLADAEQKLGQDIKDCKVNPGEYGELLREAAENKQRADKAAKKGFPVDQAKVDADLAKAGSLFNQAQAAFVQQCVRQAQGQGQAQGQAQGLPQTTPGPATTPVQPGGGAAPETVGSRITEAEKKLDADIKAGRPVNADDYEALADEARRNFRAAQKALSSGAPVDYGRVRDEYDRTIDLSERARKAQLYQTPRPPEQEPTPKSGAMNLNPFARDVLALHNTTRAQYGAPPLKWDPELAGRAGAWAGQLAGIGRLEHSPREGRGTARENLAQAPLSYSTPQIIGRWVGENVDFVPGTFPNICLSGGMCDGVLHLSQMIWPTTTALGCGLAVGQGSQWLVCYYNPGGNKDGKMVGMPLQIADIENSSSQPPLTGGGKAAVTQSQGPNAYDEYKTSKGQAALFDLGIYAGGAWTTDWFEIDPPTESVGNQININLEYGYDPGLFVGYDLGAFRLESEVAYKKAAQAIDWEPIEDLLFRGSWAEGFGKQVLPDVYTTVEQPVLLKVGKAAIQNPSNVRKCANPFSASIDAFAVYEVASFKGDASGMRVAKADLAAAITQQRQLVADVTEAGQMAGPNLKDEATKLKAMIEGYEKLTGEKAPTGQAPGDAGCAPVDTKVEQPQLPTKEVFKPDPADKLEPPM